MSCGYCEYDPETCTTGPGGCDFTVSTYTADLLDRGKRASRAEDDLTEAIARQNETNGIVAALTSERDELLAVVRSLQRTVDMAVQNSCSAVRAAHALLDMYIGE